LICCHLLSSLQYSSRNCIEQAGAVGGRFLPSGYIAPYRVGVELTARQRELPHIITNNEPAPLRVIVQKLQNPLSEATIRSDLAHPRNDSPLLLRGRGRSATWLLNRSTE